MRVHCWLSDNLFVCARKTEDERLPHAPGPESIKTAKCSIASTIRLAALAHVYLAGRLEAVAQTEMYSEIPAASGREWPPEVREVTRGKRDALAESTLEWPHVETTRRDGPSTSIYPSTKDCNASAI